MIVRHADGAAFLDRAAPFLLASEAEYNLILGLARGGTPPESLLATVEHEGDVVGCIFRVPPNKLVLTRVPAEHIPDMVAFTADVYDTIPAVLGREQEAGAFAQRWAAAHGLRARAGMRQAIHELTAVQWPQPLAAGAMRQAEREDARRCGEWVAGFARDAQHPIAEPEQHARERIERGQFWLWEDAGEPVCMAGRVGRTPHGDRIAYVYTPAERRGRGYASALVAHLSQQVLDEGLRFCFLYTDVANPTSNAIYRRLGYRVVADAVDYIIE